MTVFTDKVKQYEPRLETDLGINRVQACGIFGNLGTETGGFSALQEKRPVIAGSRGGYGWMQWTGPRRRRYEAWCTKNALNPSLDETNYKYLVYETKTDETASLAALKQATTLDQATEVFMRTNLRPGAPNLQSRKDWAKKAFEASEKPSGAGTVIAAGGVAAGGAVIASNNVQTTDWVWTWIYTGLGVAAVAALIAVVLHYANKRKENEIKAIVLPANKVRKTRGRPKGKSRAKPNVVQLVEQPVGAV